MVYLKIIRACGYRAGWLVVSGDKGRGKDYLEGLISLPPCGLCANVPGQLAIQTALVVIKALMILVAPAGRLFKQRDLAYK